MTTYSTIADSEIDPESPGTTTLFGKLRNNPLAIQENDASAPTVAYATSAGTITSQGALATLNSVNHSEISFGSTASSTVVLASGTPVIPEGFYWVREITTGDVSVEVRVNVDWLTVANTITAPYFVYSDGVNMRYNNNGIVSRTVYWIRLA